MEPFYTSIVRGALVTALAAGLLWLVTRSTHAKEGLRLTVSRPAFLVPAAMATAGVLGLMFAFGQRRVHDNPFLLATWIEGETGLPSVLVVLLVAFALAGHVGLLEAHAAGRTPGSDAFLAGVRRHLTTFVLGKAVLALGIFGMVELLPDLRGYGLVLYLLPSLFAAPLAGVASSCPRRPVAALLGTFEFVRQNTFAAGRLVTAQAGLMIGLVYVGGRWFGAGAPPELLAPQASTLGYGHFPFVHLAGHGWAMSVVTVTSVLAGAAFVTAHWLLVRDAADPAADGLACAA